MCRVVLRMTDKEFLRRTPHEVGLLLDAHASVLEIEDSRFGILCSLLANIHRDRKKQKKGYKPSDFMPNRRNAATGKPDNGKPKQTPEAQLQHLKAITALFGGTIAPRLGPMTAREAADWLKAQ